MKSRNHIKNQLENLTSLFPVLKVRYEYDPIGLCHYIQILPLREYFGNQGYLKFENELEENFKNFYQDEDICFLSDDGLYEINNPEFELNGFMYGTEEVKNTLPTFI